MPRAPKGCHNPECKNLQPCKLHTTKQWNMGRRKMPGNWKSLVRAVKTRDKSTCRKCRKLAPNGQADHIINWANGGTDDLGNLQWLCKTCHDIKSKFESFYGRSKK